MSSRILEAGLGAAVGAVALYLMRDPCKQVIEEPTGWPDDSRTRCPPGTTGVWWDSDCVQEGGLPQAYREFIGRVARELGAIPFRLGWTMFDFERWLFERRMERPFDAPGIDWGKFMEWPWDYFGDGGRGAAP